jgi:hypothetical protein
MTPEEQRIAIAEACGWTVKRWTDGEGNSVVGLLPPGVEKTSSSFRHSPDYLNDLNAMHEAEKVLDVNIESEDSPRYEYSRQVYRIVESRRQPFRSTAAQRAEAFLRTLGKWEESA